MKKFYFLLVAAILIGCGGGGGGSDSGGGGSPIGTNSVPIARIVANTTFNTGTPTTLDGTSSTDADNDLLAYTWYIFSKPAGATASISNVNAPTTTFTADLAGTYTIALSVNDGHIESAISPPTTITAVSSVNRRKVELLKGYWTFNYTIISNWTDHYTLDTIKENVLTAGDAYIYGMDDYGVLSVGSYSSTINAWGLLNPNSIMDQFYVFQTNGSSILAGSCYYAIQHPSETWSRCYPLSGSKSLISTTASLKSISNSVSKKVLHDEVLEYSAPPSDVFQEYKNLKQQYEQK